MRGYLAKMTGLSRAQVARLIRCYQQGGEVKPRPYRRHCFPQRYTRADIELLTEVDGTHDTLSGPDTQKIPVVRQNCPRVSFRSLVRAETQGPKCLPKPQDPR